MPENDSFEIFKSYINAYKDFPLPVMICDLNQAALWSNYSAEQYTRQFKNEDSVTGLFPELLSEEVLTRLKHGAACCLDGAAGLGDVRLDILPIIESGALMGIVVVTIEGKRGGFDSNSVDISRMPEIFETNLRKNIDATFKAMDDASTKADLLGEGWVKQSLERISQNEYSILRLASNLSHFAMYRSAPVSLRLAAVDIFERIGETAEIITGIAGRMGIPVHISLPMKQTFVNVDLEKAELAFFNILNNALYFTKPGNSIDITGEDGYAAATIAVRDRGMGIPHEVLPLVSQAYFSKEKDGSRAGAGLGLTVSKRIIEAHMGDLVIDSTENEGTTVVMTLPKRAFSSSVSLRQNDPPRLADRFSSVYVGLLDALRSPHIGA